MDAFARTIALNRRGPEGAREMKGRARSCYSWMSVRHARRWRKKRLGDQGPQPGEYESVAAGRGMHGKHYWGQALDFPANPKRPAVHAGRFLCTVPAPAVRLLHLDVVDVDRGRVVFRHEV